MNKKSNTDILDDVYFEAALVESEHRRSIHPARTPEHRRWTREVVESYRTRIADLRRSRLPASVTPVKAKPIRASTLALGRDALLGRLAEILRTRSGEIRYAHRNLKGLSDDDLRRMLDLLETGHDPE